MQVLNRTLLTINALFFSLSFPIMYWALRRRFDDATALHSVVACLLIPALLIYGRSDDAVYYFFVVIIIALISIAIQEKRYFLTICASGLMVGAMNLSYAAVVLLPAMLSFSANGQMSQIWQHFRRVIPHALILLIAVSIAVALEKWMTGFYWPEAFSASVRYNNSSTIIPMLERGNYARVLNDRIMAISDFLVFGGPLFFYLFIRLFKNRKKDFASWQIKNIALILLLCALAINSNGPGEVSRPWGSLFLLIGFYWLADFFSQENEKTRWLLIRAQLVWALILQVPLNFGW